MRNKILSVFFFCSVILSFSAIATKLDLPTQRIGKTEFYIYKVTTKETIYGIAKKLKVSKDDILKYNPSAVDGLKANQTLFFPVNEFVEPVNDSSKERQNEFHHLVERGETLYGLSKLYNISQDEIIKANPEIADGVKAGFVLIIPQKSKEIASVTSDEKEQSALVFHTIKKGDTLYNLSQKYNTTIDNILALNPGVSPTSFKIDEVIRIQPDVVIPIPQKIPVTEFYSHKLSKNETFYSIAKNYGITEQELRQANPGITELKKNQFIYIPKTAKPLEVVNVEEKEKVSPTKIKEIYDSVHTINKKQSIDIALLLPYMLNTSKPDKQANLYTEFYKGFLLAVDSVRKSTDKKINIYTYDTENSMAKLGSILSKPELKTVDLIFCPENAQQIDTIALFAKKYDINLINTFSIKNESYSDNPHFFQVNVPHSYMYAKVMDWYDNKFGDRDIIFLSQTDSPSDEKEMINEFKKYLAEHKNIKSHNVEFKGTLQISVLDSIMQPNKKYAVIPTSGTKNMIAKICGALKKVKSEKSDVNFVLLGYPEWSTYLADYKETFQKLDTYIYSRFFANINDSNYKDFESKYKYWYNDNMILAAPQFGLLGFDSGMYFLNAVANNDNDFNHAQNIHHGIQNDFNFERVSNWSGFINKSLYFVHFTPYSTIEKISQ